MHRRLLLPGVALLVFVSPAFAQVEPPTDPPAQDSDETVERRESPTAEGEEAVLAEFRQRLHHLDPAIQWQEGPGAGAIGSVAKIDVPAHMSFTGKEGTRRFMVALKNLPGDQLATAQLMEPPFWSAYFSYEDAGHVKDTDKGELDAKKLLDAMQEGCKEENVERKRRGLDELDIVGWAVPPHYDDASHNLEWGTKLRSSNADYTVNYQVRLLARVGLVSTTLVCSPEDLDEALPQFRSLIASLDFNPGQHYGEFKPGDKVADATLTALIVGGAAALGWKVGIFKYLWKILGAIGVGIAALWRKLTGRKKQTPKPYA